MWQDSSVDYVPLLLSLLAVDVLAAISPGPNFVLVMQTSIRSSRRDAAAVVVGFAVSNLIWCCAVLFGLSALFALSPWLYRILQFCGAAYLIYLGVNLWRTEKMPAISSQAGAGFLRGLLTNLTNPKSVVYFGSVFALFMGPRMPLWVQVAGVGIVLLNTLWWYGTVAAVFSHDAVQRRFAALQRPINRVAGTVMIAFGARLIFARR